MATNDTVVAPDEVNSALQDIAAEEGFKKPRFHVEPGMGVGDGFTSALFRAKIEDSDDGGRKKHLSVICKTLEKTGPSPWMDHVFGGEASMYTKILPAIAKIGDLKPPLPWARCYHASTGDPDRRPCLVFGDLREEGFTMADRRKPLDREHCRLALSHLAKFHGGAIALNHLHPEEFQAMTAPLDGRSFQDPEMLKRFETFFSMIRSTPDLLADVFPEGGEVNSRLKKLFGETAVALFTNLYVPSMSSGNGIIHGDCHINNMMFKYDKGTGAVTGCQLIDFQMCRPGNTAMDIGNLMIPCTDKATRDEHWDTLLRGYHSELQEILKTAGIEDPDAVYSWDLFTERLKDAYVLGIVFAPMLLHATHADVADAQEIRDFISEIDKSVDSQPTVSLKMNPVTKQRLADIVRTAVEKGWI